MCLLINQPATAPSLPDHWLSDFYSYNSDGAGIMYVENGKLHVHKIVPKDAQDFIKLYREYAEGRDCAIHLRYKTHGDIDTENTHPYEVFGEDHPDGALWMMHNGVLSTGNTADTTKSDTWHFIRDYLRPILNTNRALLHSPEFQDMLGGFIGNNRFTFLEQDGRMVTINEHQGVFWGGRWMSNTYAWTAPAGALSTSWEEMDKELAKVEVSEVPTLSYGRVGDPRTAGTWSYGTAWGDTHGGMYSMDMQEQIEEEYINVMSSLDECGLTLTSLGVTEDQVYDAVNYLGEQLLLDAIEDVMWGYSKVYELGELIKHPDRFSASRDYDQEYDVNDYPQPTYAVA